MENKEFEKYLNNIEFDDKPDYQHRDKLEKKLIVSLAEKSRKEENKSIRFDRIFKLAAAACLIIAIVIGVKIYLKKDSGTIHTPNINQEQLIAEELIQVRHMIVANDFKGLYDVLSDGQFESKIVAANFLAKMGKVPELVNMPALESVSMYAEGDLILDCVGGSLRLRSLRSKEWLEVENRKIKVYKNQDIKEAEQVRIKHNIDEIQEDWELHEMEFANLREQRTDLEIELAKLNQNTQEDEIKKLRERLVKYNEMLDIVDDAVYVSIDANNLKLDNPKYHRTAIAELLDGKVKVEWHGHIVEGNSVTLLYNLASVLTDGPPKPMPGWRERFDAVYSLNEGEIIRWVRTPYIPERQIYATQELHYYSSTDNPPPPGYMSFFWDGDKVRNWALMMSEGGLGSVFSDMGFQRYEYKIELEKLHELCGDWIIREKASKEEKILALEKVLQNELDSHIQFEKRKESCDSIIVSGQYKFVPLENVENPNRIYIYTDLFEDFPGPEPTDVGRTKNLDDMLEMIGNHFKSTVIFESENLSNIRVPYFNSLSYDLAIANTETDEEKRTLLISVLENLSKQTSLHFEYGKSEMDVWYITEQEGNQIQGNMVEHAVNVDSINENKHSVTVNVKNQKNGELLSKVIYKITSSDNEDNEITTGAADENGQFKYNLSPGDYKLFAQGWKNGRIYQFTKNFSVDSNNTNTNVEIEILTRPIIHGWLVDSNDNFLPGTVTLDGDTVETNENGEFFIPEPWWFPGDKPTMYAFDSDKKLGFAFFWDRENDMNDLVIVLQPTAQIKGRVIDVNGQGLGDIEPQIGITIHDQGWLYSSENPWTTKVEKDGHFKIENVPVGFKMVVSIEKPGYYGSCDLPDLNPGQILELGDIKLKAKHGFEDGQTDWTGILTGYVTNETGEPMQDIRVWADGAEGVSEYRTDSNGYFQLENLPKDKITNGGLYADGYGHNGFKQLIDGSELNIQIFPQGWELLNKPAPDLLVDKWLNTEPVKLEQYKEKVILLQVGVLLPQYQDKFDILQDLLNKYSDEGLRVIVVHEPLYVTWAGKVTEQDIRDFIKKNDIKFPFGIDYDGQKLFNLYQSKVTPATYLIDKKGILRISPKKNELEEWIKKFLDE
ncbi:MAG: redoxin domain-containing protein [Sedimentisphaerales bacterium]|nr:redoxin domain-containing protein [Sedimentisphaerales bacterium]